MIKDRAKHILKEIDSVLNQLDEDQVSVLADQILSSKKIVTVGAGRVGMAARAFAMRLKHLGLDAYHIGDSNVPAVKAGDLVLVASGSGETQTIYDLAVIAKKHGTHLVVITANRDSRIGEIADIIVDIKAPAKKVPPVSVNLLRPAATLAGADVLRSSIQPMTTLNEQCLHIFFDALVLDLMDKMGETHDTMWDRHSRLE